MTDYTIGFSTCPNDTFIFHAMIHGLVDIMEHHFAPRLHDVEELNQKAFKNVYPISKLSFYAYLKLRETYSILDAGSALGSGCGPMLVGRNTRVPGPEAKIAIPGEFTTAYLLLRLWCPEYRNIEVVRFDRILQGVQSGEFDAGLIIHEGRFVYEQYQCRKIIDLGEWWENEIGHPIPLGCIAVRKDKDILAQKDGIDQILKRSIKYAWANPAASRRWVKSLAQEMADEVIDSHIGLYVNDYSYSLGEKGRAAIQTLEKMALDKNIL